MSEQSVSAFIASELATRKREAAKKKNAAAYPEIYPEIARLVIGSFPTLTAAERAEVFKTLKGDAASLGHDATMALRQVSRILAVTNAER